MQLLCGSMPEADGRQGRVIVAESEGADPVGQMAGVFRRSMIFDYFINESILGSPYRKERPHSMSRGLSKNKNNENTEN